jgi:hypothetical protein
MFLEHIQWKEGEQDVHKFSLKEVSSIGADNII